MSVQERKQRERAERERLIVATARQLAEQQGWDAVTTRQLAERIEYSQPVLYSHFRGKREIIGAVALQGAAELAARELKDPRPAVRGAALDALAAVAEGAAIIDLPDLGGSKLLAEAGLPLFTVTSFGGH